MPSWKHGHTKQITLELPGITDATSFRVALRSNSDTNITCGMLSNSGNGYYSALLHLNSGTAPGSYYLEAYGVYGTTAVGSVSIHSFTVPVDVTTLS